jgi:hypothetical protein
MTSDLRRRALDAIDELVGDAATGPAVLRRLSDLSFADKSGAGDHARDTAPAAGDADTASED